MPGASIVKVVPFFINRGYKNVIDFGSGTFRNTKYLQNNGFVVVAVDKAPMISKWAVPEKGNFPMLISAVTAEEFECLNVKADAVVCNFVMNLLDFSTNNILAQCFAQKVRIGGVVLVEVKEKRNDYINNAMTTEQLDKLFLLNGFCRLTKFCGRISLTVIYERIE